MYRKRGYNLNRILEDDIQDTSLHRDRLFEVLVYIYFAITFFEPYLNGVLGSVTKYYIFAIMMYVLLKNKFCLGKRQILIIKLRLRSLG